MQKASYTLDIQPIPARTESCSRKWQRQWFDSENTCYAENTCSCLLGVLVKSDCNTEGAPSSRGKCHCAGHLAILNVNCRHRCREWRDSEKPQVWGLQKYSLAIGYGKRRLGMLKSAIRYAGKWQEFWEPVVKSSVPWNRLWWELFTSWKQANTINQAPPTPRHRGELVYQNTTASLWPSVDRRE